MNSFLFVTRRVLGVACLLSLMMAGSVHAGAPEVLTQGQQLYSSGKFAECIDLLTKLGTDSTLATDEKKSVYLLLARACAGKNFLDQSEAYLKKVLALDPSFQLNIKAEPPQVQKIWFKVDQQRQKGTPPAPGLKTMAVLYFDNNSVVDRDKLDGLSKGLSAMLVTDLSKLSALKVLERERIQYILDELKLQRSQYVDPKTADTVARLLGANTMLMGSFTKLSRKSMRIDWRLVNTSTSEIITADKVEGNPDKLAQLLSDLSNSVANTLKLAVSDYEKKELAKTGDQPIEAVLAYTRGLNLEDEQKLAEAYGAYKEALTLYPKHEAARDRLAALQPVVAPGG